MTRSSVVLPAPFGPMIPVNSPLPSENETSLQHLAAAEPHADTVQLQHVGVPCGVTR